MVENIIEETLEPKSPGKRKRVLETSAGLLVRVT